MKSVRWCPHQPYPIQAKFLALDCLEAFYGGAAGPGKSDALLMGALQHVHVPHYSALILRLDYPRLSLSGGLIPRSAEWLSNTDARWSATDKRWTFPSGATISFGYLDNPMAKFRYGSSEYQYIAWDELTEFPEESYRFMFSRLRKTKDNPVPLRMRSASNPGGPGHQWVKDRFITQESMDALRDGRHGIYWKGDRAFVPGRIKDNPSLDEEQYNKALEHLDPITRERLKAGDWSINEDSKIKPEWLRYWTNQGDYYRLHENSGDYLKRGGVTVVFTPAECQRIIIVDCAGSSDDVTRERKGKPKSHSVIATYDFHRRDGWLILRHMRRGRWAFPDLCQQIREEFRDQRPEWIGIENEKTGAAVLQTLGSLPTRGVSHEGKDKLARAGTLLNDLAAGKVFIPQEGQMRTDIESEWLVWDGHPDTPFDIGDTAAYAAKHVDRLDRSGVITLEGGLFLR